MVMLHGNLRPWLHTNCIVTKWLILKFCISHTTNIYTHTYIYIYIYCTFISTDHREHMCLCNIAILTHVGEYNKPSNQQLNLDDG